MTFFRLDFAEEQLDFPVLYASAKEGWASLTFTKNPPDNAKNMSSLLDSIIQHVPSPKADLESPFQMLVSMFDIVCGAFSISFFILQFHPNYAYGRITAH